MGIELLNVKALFNNNKALIQGLEEIHAKRPKLYSELTRKLWSLYVHNNHGNDDEITTSLLSKEEWREQHISSLDVEGIPSSVEVKGVKLEKRIDPSIINEEFLRCYGRDWSEEDQTEQICSTIELFNRNPLKSEGKIEKDELKFRRSLSQQYECDEVQETLKIFSYLCGDYDFPECVEEFILNDWGQEELDSGEWVSSTQSPYLTPMELTFLLGICTTNRKPVDDGKRAKLIFDDIREKSAKADYRKMLLQAPLWKKIEPTEWVKWSNKFSRVEKFFGGDEDLLVDISTIENVEATESYWRLLEELRAMGDGIGAPFLHDLLQDLRRKGVWDKFVEKVNPPLVDLIIEFNTNNDSIKIKEYLTVLQKMWDHAEEDKYKERGIRSIVEEGNLRRIIELFDDPDESNYDSELKGLKEFLYQKICQFKSSPVDMMISWTNICIEKGIKTQISQFDKNKFTEKREESEMTFDAYLLHSAGQIIKQVGSTRREIQ